MSKYSQNGIKLAADFSQSAEILDNDFTDQNLHNYGIAHDALVDYIYTLEETVKMFIDLSNEIRINEHLNKRLSETKEFEKLRALTSEARILLKEIR